jgi:hypothetical protein
MTKAWLLLCLPPLGCAHATIATITNPRVHSMERFALVAFYGPEHVDVASSLMFARAEQENVWGPAFVEEVFDATSSRVEAAIRKPLIPIDRVLAARSYKVIPAAATGIPEVAPRGLRPLGIHRENTESLAGLAKELGVDGVLSIQNSWRVVGTPDQPVVEVESTFVIVAADQTRPWLQAELSRSLVEASANTAAPIEGMMLSETATRQAMFRALLKNLDRFALKWSESEAR